MSGSGIYAGWIVINVHLLVFLSLLCAGVSALLVALILRHRVWYEYVSLFAAAFLLLFLLGFMIFQFVLSRPIVVERDFFPF